ncbi:MULTISPECIES: anti-sigma factor domain-containing protein [unclassified Cupriavidus]|uniref:anti-sigma factor n=1 Tax=unclassified Cupriavidus TaxID=2640874 RepID=UPI00040CA6D1|nr:MULTISPECIES: anti-sigma factor [unclassified Cupriavidus]MBP0633964.1 anti-sigma factor [Cupriavidus sp. AcVe19-6a]
MKLAAHPELLDRLAAQYALGVLRGGARRRMEHLAREEPAVHAAILRWQDRLAGVSELQATAEPVDKVWCGIETRLGWKAPVESLAPGPPMAEPAAGWWQRLWSTPLFWRGAAAAMAVVAVLSIGIGMQVGQQREAAPAAIIAVLNDDHAQPAMLVSWDASARSLIVRRLDHLELSERQVLQLWALPADGKPRSLGVIGRAPQARLALAEPPAAVPALAVSIEPTGGSPSADGPSGPVVFKGPVLHNPL